MSSRVMVALRVGAPPSRVFAAFTEEIGSWWQPNALFRINGRRQGRLGFEPGPDGRLVETYDDGDTFEIGRIREWAPPHRLAFSWRAANFPRERSTEVRVRFEPVGGETRVTVEHLGWDSLPQQHAARHGFPLGVFQRRNAEWWQVLLGALRAMSERPSGYGETMSTYEPEPTDQLDETAEPTPVAPPMIEASPSATGVIAGDPDEVSPAPEER